MLLAGLSASMSVLWCSLRSERLFDVTESVPGIGISGESPLAKIGSASRTMPKEATVLLRGAFDLGVRREPQAFAADAVILGGIMDFEYGPGIE